MVGKQGPGSVCLPRDRERCLDLCHGMTGRHVLLRLLLFSILPAGSSESRMKTEKTSKRQEPPPSKKASSSPAFNEPVSRTHLYVGAVFAALAVSLSLTHYLVPAPISAVSYELPEPELLPGDSRLFKAQLLLQDQIYGPESIAVEHSTGKIFVGLKTGLICEVKITNKEARIVQAVRLTSRENCDGSYKSAPLCGRPLGLRFDDDSRLIVVDAYLGVFYINWKNSSVHTLLLGGAQITNDDSATPVRYLNDVGILPDGRLILSESSRKFDDRDFIYDMLEHRPNGRVLAFEPKNKTLTVLIDNLYTPNGITIYKGKVLVAEMGLSRIIKYSPSRDTYSVLVDNLPGYPDNLRTAHDGNIWVPLAASRSSSDNWLARRPGLRELITKVLSPQALAWVVDLIASPEGIVLKIHPESGEILDVLRDTTGRITGVTTAIEDGKGGLLLGNDNNYYLGRLKL